MTQPTTRDAGTPAGVLRLDGYARMGAADGEARSLDEASRSVDYVCSTEALDSHESIVRQNWRLDRYRMNPVVLFAHDKRSIPIGTASNVRVENGRLMARVTFATAEVSEDADECWRAVKAGLMRGISVGFYPHSYRWESDNDVERLVLDDNELLELSVCAVPSNPETLAQRSASLATLRAQALAQRPAPKDTPAMTQEEIKALRDEVASRAANETRLAADLAASKAAHDAAVADLSAARTDLASARSEVESLRAATIKLNDEADALKTRADAAEDKVARLEIESRLGKDVDPEEVEDLLRQRRALPDVYERTLARRSSRNDALTSQVIPAGAPATRDAASAANPTANLMAAINALSPVELPPWLLAQPSTSPSAPSSPSP